MVEELVLDENRLLGKWKVTEYAVTDNGILVPSYNIAEHFLGRSIVIDKDKIIKSIDYWPSRVDYVSTSYKYIEKTLEEGRAYGVRNKYKDFWYQEFEEQMLEVYLFWNENDGIENGEEFIITEDGKVLSMYLGSYFYMEPYILSKTNIYTEQLYGAWKVVRLVSYQNGWKGNNAVIKEAHRFNPETIYSEEEGANFYPLDYYNASFEWNSDSVKICMGNGTSEQYSVSEYESELIKTKMYQEEQEIHDELGLINDEIQVVNVDFTDEDEERLWNGDIVVVSEERIIIKLYQGWFLLEKNSE